MYHVLTHAIMKGGAFLVVGATSSAGIGEELSDYRGLSRRMPFAAGAMAIFLLSLAGIPPFGGFFSKFVLFSSAINAMPYNPWYLALAVSGVLNSALSLYYYARVIWYMWVLDPPEGATRVPMGKAITAAIAIAFVMIWVTGIGAYPFISYLQGAARTFFGI
jgi:NADH:ubiquinone oxidoreductase subunit 2 (subunit N)